MNGSEWKGWFKERMSDFQQGSIIDALLWKKKWSVRRIQVFLLCADGRPKENWEGAKVEGERETETGIERQREREPFRRAIMCLQGEMGLSHTTNL